MLRSAAAPSPKRNPQHEAADNANHSRQALLGSAGKTPPIANHDPSRDWAKEFTLVLGLEACVIYLAADG